MCSFKSVARIFCGGESGARVVSKSANMLRRGSHLDCVVYDCNLTRFRDGEKLKEEENYHRSIDLLNII